MQKIFLKKLLFTLGLYPLVEQFNFRITQLRNRKNNQNFRKEHPNLKIPPDFYLYETFGLDYRRYYNGGRDAAAWVVNHLQKHLDFDREITILDWGCGPGRIVRHLPEIMGLKNHFFGTDYNTNYTAWCAANIHNVHFCHNQLAPPLPFSDGHFDAIYGISIFTHLSEEMHVQWIRELNRVTKISGIALITTHGAPFLQKLSTTEKEQFQQGKLVEHIYKIEGNRLFAAYQPSAYFRDLCEANGFAVLEHISKATTNQKPQQDTWIIQKVGAIK